MNVRKIKPYLELIRLPNGLTVFGDIFLGYLIVSSAINYWDLTLLVISSLCFYYAGMTLNDLADRKEDTINGLYHRPLVSKKISISNAWILFASLITIGIILSAIVSLASFVVGVLLVLLIIAYNFLKTSFTKTGFALMGSCRFMNIMLGASVLFAWNHPAIIYVALIESLYIYLVCIIAKNETNKLPEKVWCMAPVRFLAASMLLLSLAYLSNISLVNITIILFSIIICFFVCFSLKPYIRKEMIAKRVGVLIHLIILIQASLLSLIKPEYISLSIILVMLFLAASVLHRAFYAS